MNRHNISFALKENRGKFIKPCPGTPRYICCGYRIINFAQGCTLGCSYCILDHYFDGKRPVFFINHEKLVEEVKNALSSTRGILRFGTGEFTDSLLFEESFPLYHRIIPLFAHSGNAVLEIKTKTTNINSLLSMREKENVIVSWSLNSDYIAKREEPGAPDIDARIEAAREVERCGFRTAFHFDPIIEHHGWQEEYERTVDLLFTRVNPSNVVYVSMGTLRFIPAMGEIMKRRGASYMYGDFIRGLDGKTRYFRPLRTKMYRKLLSRLTHYIPDDKVYLCMENSDVWKDVFHIDCMNDAKLIDRLDRACLEAFPNLSAT
jgi:spore photoproduct lyase